MEDKLKLIYLSGNYDLCFELMKGVDIDYLDIELHETSETYDLNSEKFQISVFGEQFSREVKASCKPLTYEVSLIELDGGGNSYIHFNVEMLKTNNLTHLIKYLGEDSTGLKSLLFVPKIEVLKMIFLEYNE